MTTKGKGEDAEEEPRYDDGTLVGQVFNLSLLDRLKTYPTALLP